MSLQNLTLCLPRASSGLDPKAAVIVATKVSKDDLPPYHILIKVERFGFSANNITYQALGEHPHFRYFDFHYAPTTNEVSPKTHGLVPVWGFGTVVASSHPKIVEGEKVYGYLAPCRYLLIPVSQSDVNKHAFYVSRPHLPADRRPYNQITRCANDPQYTPTIQGEELTMIHRPLFWTSYWCEDWLSLSGFRGASSILISSASAKTAFCLAYVIGKRLNIPYGHSSKSVPLKIIGLTSKRNVAFTRSLGLYTDVVDYDSLTTAPCLKAGQVLYVDVNGNGDLNKQIFAHFRSTSSRELVGSIGLGYTNLEPTKRSTELKWNTDGPADPSKKQVRPVDAIEQFFMVEWLDQRKNQLSLQEIFNRQQKAWDELIKDCVPWLRLERVYDQKGILEAYRRISNGKLGPDVGYAWSLWDKEQKNVAAKL